LYIRVTNDRPDLTTLVACWSSPTKESIYLFLAFFLTSNQRADALQFLKGEMSFHGIAVKKNAQEGK